MNWISIALAAYFLLALSYVIDKFILSERVPKPSVFAFYVALLSFATIFLVPFGFYWQGIGITLEAAVSGALYIYAVLFLYKAVKVNEISRVSPLVFAVTALATVFISVAFLGEKITFLNFSGIFFLVAGGLLISFDLPVKSKKIFNGFNNSVIAGILFAFAYAIAKHVYGGSAFINGYIMTRAGIFLGGLGLLLIPEYKKQIFSSFKDIKNNRKKNLATAAIIIGSKALGGGFSILLNYAIFLGNVSVVNAIASVQFVFILIFSGLASLKFPKLFGEKLFFWDWFQKIAAIFIIGLGIFLIYD